MQLSCVPCNDECIGKTNSYMYMYVCLCDFQNVIGEELLKERLDMETLESSALVASKNNFNQKYVKTKTKLL